MRTLVFAIALSAVACGGGGPTSPSGQPERFTWTVNGESFSASSNGRRAVPQSGARVVLIGTNCSTGAYISVDLGSPATGTFPIESQGNVMWVPSGPLKDVFGAPGPFGGGPGSGTVTITSLTNDRISGTFSVIALPFFSNQDQAQKTITGSFSLQIEDGSVC